MIDKDILNIPSVNLQLMVTDCFGREDKEDVLLDSVLAYGKGLVLTANEAEANAVRAFLDELDTGAEVVIETFGGESRAEDADFAFLVHWNLPHSLEEYCRDLGRVGRDGRSVFCELLVDCEELERILGDRSREETPAARLQRTLINWTCEPGCRRKALLNYLGVWTPLDACGLCDNCAEMSVANMPF